MWLQVLILHTYSGGLVEYKSQSSGSGSAFRYHTQLRVFLGPQQYNIVWETRDRGVHSALP